MSRLFRVIGSIVDIDDCKVIAVILVAVLLVAVLLITLAGAAGLAVAVFEEVRGM